MGELAETEEVSRRILLLRGARVILDSDLAGIYGVPTRVLNQAVKRNLRRFPADFVFRLTAHELEDIRSRFATSSNQSQIVTGPQKHRDPRFLPYAFSEHGAIMAANVLNSRRAVQMSVFVVRAFVRLREMIASHKDMVKRLDELEKKYDAQFKSVFDAIRQLMTPPPPAPRRIGFRREGPK